MTVVKKNSFFMGYSGIVGIKVLIPNNKETWLPTEFKANKTRMQIYLNNVRNNQETHIIVKQNNLVRESINLINLILLI